MVELIEYILVFGVTVSISALSILILSGSLPVLGQSEARAEMEEIEGAANLAAVNGNSTLVIPLSGASLSCSQGAISFSAGASQFSSPVDYPCSFRFEGISCLCTLVFTRSEDGLTATVSG